MKVTIRIDDELRKKPYWRKVADTDEFEYVKDRAPNGSVLIDRQGRSVLCAKERLIFHAVTKIAEVDSGDPGMISPPIIPGIIDTNETKD